MQEHGQKRVLKELKRYSLPLGVGEQVGHYIIDEVLDPGGRGNTYRARHEDDAETQVVIKIASIDPTRTPREIEDRLGKVLADVTHEVTAWSRLRQNPVIWDYIAPILEAGSIPAQLYPNGTIYMVPYIVQDYIAGLSLKKYCGTLAKRSENGSPSVFTGLKDPKLWFALAKKLVWIVSLVHQERIVHADIWPPNIIIRPNGEPVLIDFGQSWLAERIHQTGEDRIRYAYYAPERQIDELRTWYAPVDVYAISGVLHYLATGEEPPSPYKAPFKNLYERRNMGESLTPQEAQLLRETPAEKKYKTKTQLREEIVDAMLVNDRNRDLYQGNLGIPDIILYGLRPRVEERAFSANHLLELLEVFDHAADRLDAPTVDELSSLLDPIKTLDLLRWEGSRDIYSRMLMRDLRSIRHQLGGVSAGIQHYAIPGGNRDHVVNHLLLCFSALQRGDKVFALTTPTFWYRHNFGMKGRLLSALKIAAINGVTIRWVQGVSEAELLDQESVIPSLEAQREAIEEVLKISKGQVDVESKREDETGFYLGYVPITPAEKENIARRAETFLLFQQDDQPDPCFTFVAPTYITAGGEISSLRVWHGKEQGETQWLERQAKFREMLANSLPVRTYRRTARRPSRKRLPKSN